jgi:hypothetical protein
MDKTKKDGKFKITKTQRIAAIVVVVVAVGSLLATIFYAEQRSVENYCKVYTQEKERLSKLPGDTYPSGVFNDEISDAGEFAASLGRLEKVAPDEISKDVEVLRKSYQVTDEDPSKAIAASLNTGSIDRSIKEWTAKNCQ